VSMADTALSPLWPYIVLILIGFLPSEIWRMLGVVLSRGLDERSQIIVWVRAVATTLLAAVVMKLLLTPTGALAAAPFFIRIAAVGIGVGAFYLFRRSVIAGVLAGEAVLISVTYLALA
jgi:hypothetical protein